jgi:hypothetical protein
MKNCEFDFDLQLFGESVDNEPGTEAGGADTNPAAEAEAGPQAGGQGQTVPGGAANQDSETMLGKAAEKAVEYDFKNLVPEGMEYSQEQADAFASIAREMKLTSEQANKLASYGMSYAGGMAKMAEVARQQEMANWGNEARKELGIDFDSTMQKAGAGLEAMEKAIPNLRAALNHTGAGNRIEFIRMLAFVGDLTKEDTFKGFGANSGVVRSSIYGNTNFGLY